PLRAPGPAVRSGSRQPAAALADRVGATDASRPAAKRDRRAVGPAQPSGARGPRNLRGRRLSPPAAALPRRLAGTDAGSPIAEAARLDFKRPACAPGARWKRPPVR